MIEIKDIPWMLRSAGQQAIRSRVWDSNWRTKCITAQKDPRQEIPDLPYTIPKDPKTRILMAKLIYEETMETIQALGVRIVGQNTTQNFEACNEVHDLDIYEIIDGACDLIYVATGILTGMNVPDIVHLNEVCTANERKFPNNEVITDPLTGKYLKPEGWVGPHHNSIRAYHMQAVYKPNLEASQS